MHPWRKSSFITLAAILFVTAPAIAGAPAAPRKRWILVTAPAFAEALEPLKKHRAAEGFDVITLKTTDVLTPADLEHNDGRKLVDKVRVLWAPDPANSCVLLVGAEGAATAVDIQSTLLPLTPGTAGRMASHPTDDPYGCAPGELQPKVAVGRWPARSAAEVKAMVDKTLAFEADGTSAAWRRSLTLLVGNPGGDSVAERALGNWYVSTQCAETSAEINPAWNVRALYHIVSSPWYVPDAALHEQSLAFLKQGQTFSFYLGHASADGFWSDGAAFLDRDDFAALAMPHGAGVFMTCGCFSCQLDPQARTAHEGFGLAAMRNPGGPVAVIGATGESYSAAGQLAFKGMLKGLSGPALPARLGQSWLDVEAGIAAGPMSYLTFTLFDYGDGSAGKTPLAAQRQEHLEMWMLLGDPALKLPDVSPEITLTAPASAAAGDNITITGDLPAAMANATVRLTLERPTGGVPQDMAPLPAGPDQAKVALGNFQKAQNPVLKTITARVSGIHFSAQLELPALLPWDQVILRAVAESGGKQALGVLRLNVIEKQLGH